MTVFNPSFPPESCITTSTLSPRCSAARADAVNRNCGTNGASDTRLAEPIAVFRNERRVVAVMPFAIG
jgi:hypothetical protein